MKYITIMVGFMLALASFSSNASDVDMQNLCKDIARKQLREGVITTQQEFDQVVQVCLGTPGTVSQETPVSPRARDTVAVVDTEYNAEIRRLRAQNEARMEQMRMRYELRASQQRLQIELQNERRIRQAQTDNQIAAIKASAPIVCSNNVRRKGSQNNFNPGPILGPAIEYGLGKVLGGKVNRDAAVGRVSQAAGAEVQGRFLDQSWSQTENCDGTYLVSEMPGVNDTGLVSAGKQIYNLVRN